MVAFAAHMNPPHSRHKRYCTMSGQAKSKIKKSEKRQRINVQAFRMVDDELARFQEHCEAADLKPADFIRVKCCSSKPLRKRERRDVHRFDEKKLAKILGLLGKSGSNHNQIAHALNIAMKSADFGANNALLELRRFEQIIMAIQADIIECRALVRETLLGRDLNG